MNENHGILANITITYNHLNQFECIITGEDDMARTLARQMIELAHQNLGEKIQLSDNSTNN